MAHTDNHSRSGFAGNGLLETRELAEGELEAISGGKPKNPPPPPQKYLTMVMNDVLISSY